MKKFSDPHNKHLRRYLLLGIIIFSLLMFFHGIILAKSLKISVGSVEIMTITSCFAFAASSMMVLMGIYYYRISKK